MHNIYAAGQLRGYDLDESAFASLNFLLLGSGSLRPVRNGSSPMLGNISPEPHRGYDVVPNMFASSCS